MWFSLNPETRGTQYKSESVAGPAGAGAMKKLLLLAEMLLEEETVDYRINMSKTNTIPKLTAAESRMEKLPYIYPMLNFHPSLIIKKQNKTKP